MAFLSSLFGEPEINQLDPERKAEVKQLIDKLVKIGNLDDFLSLTPGGHFNMQCHHPGAREIGERLNAIGGLPLMTAVRKTIRRKLKDVLAEQLDHCWKGIGDWQA